MDLSGELLTSLSDAELTALADGLLAPSSQLRVDELLRRNAEGPLSAEEKQELDTNLARIDQLNILKTRARLTLRRQAAGMRGH